MSIVSFVYGLGIGVEENGKILVRWFYCFISPDRVSNPVRANHKAQKKATRNEVAFLMFYSKN